LHIRSFHQGWWLTVGSLSTCLQLPPALRPRHGPVHVPSNPRACTVYRAQLSRRVSLAECRVWASYRTAGPYHLLSAPAALTTPRRPNPGVMACHSLTRTQADPLIPCPRIISCRNLTRHAGRGGRRTHALPNSQPGFYCTAARDR